MLKEYNSALRKLMIFVDLCIVTVSFFLGYFLRQNFRPRIYPFETYLVFLPALLMMWGFLLYSFKMYQSFRVKRLLEMFLIILKAAVTGFILFGSVTYVLKITYV